MTEKNYVRSEDITSENIEQINRFPDDGLSVGDIVHHPEYGYGVVGKMPNGQMLISHVEKEGNIVSWSHFENDGWVQVQPQRNIVITDEVELKDLHKYDYLVSDESDHEFIAITGAIYASNAMGGLTIVETGVGSIYLDPDFTVRAAVDA